MSDPEDTPENGDERDAAGNEPRSGSFLTSGPALIGAFATLVTAITGLIIGLNQVGWIGGDDGGPGTATPATQAEADHDGTDADATTGAAAVFRPTKKTDRGRLYFEGKTMYVTASERGNPLVVPGDKRDPVGDVRVRVRARRDSGAERYWVGLICRYVDRKNYYALMVWSGGRYRIVKYDGTGPITLKQGSLTTSETGPEDVIEARCVDDNPTRLTLVVNGEQVTDDDETGIESGLVGIRVGTDVDGVPVTVRFDDFDLGPP